ncbi:MAG: AAA family ATPase [Myxococcota bacterium]
MKLTELEFDHFKGLRDITVSCGPGLNILVGRNNAGKSTALSPLRMLEPTLRVARRRNPLPFRFAGTKRRGWQIREDGLPVSLENVHTDLLATPTSVRMATDDGGELWLRFPYDGGAFLEASAPRGPVPSAASFRRAFPLELHVCPVIGPVEHDEPLVRAATVRRGWGTHRASRHFRNTWHHFPEHFERFAGMLADTWDGAHIGPPELHVALEGAVLHMFVEEGRRPRELYWCGFGLQVWCQLLTWASRVPEGGIFVVDEPETYLHPTLQQRFLEVLRSLGAQVFIATHSASIVADAHPGEVLVVDRMAGTVVRPERSGVGLAQQLGMLPRR